MTAPTRLTVEAVASYAHFFTPSATDPSETPKYSAELVFDEGYDYTEIGKAIEAAIFAKWGGNPPANLKMPIADPRTKEKKKDNPFYAGKFYLNARSSEAIGVYDENNQPIVDQSVLYSGCRVLANVNFYGYSYKGISNGVACGLNAVKKVSDGDRLDNRPSVEDMFGAPASSAETPAASGPGIPGIPGM